MSKISSGLKKTIEKIKRLADGSIDDQLIACKEYLQKLFDHGKPKPGIYESIIRELLPTIIKFMESDNHVLQKEGAGFIINITYAPDLIADIKLVIDANAIIKLKNLLSSTNRDVLYSALRAFVNIAFYFPEKVLENEVLPTIIQSLKSDDELVSYHSAWIMQNISNESEERIAAIFEANGVKPLIKILESKNIDGIECALKALLNITSCNYQYCESLLELGTLKSLKKLCDRLFIATKKLQFPSKAYLIRFRYNKMVKLLAIKLIRNITSYGEDQVELIINDNFIPTILQQIKGGMTPEIKIESIKVIENVISVKHGFIPALIQDYNIFSFCYSNLGSSNADLLITTLTVMCNIIEVSEDRDNIPQKIRECDGDPTKLTNLYKHSNEEVRHLSTMLYEFVFDVKPDPTAVVSTGSNQQEPAEVISLDSEDDDTPAVKTPQIGRRRKRPAYTPPVGPIRRSKRFRVSLEQTDTENSDCSSSDENDNDFDDHPRSSSSVNSTPGAAPTESNLHNYSGRQSSVGENTVDTDEKKLNPKEERPPTPQNLDMPTTPASRRSPTLPVASTSTNTVTVQDEMKPSISGRLGNQSRFSSINSHVVPETSSTNDGNICNNHAGRQIIVDSETAETADGTVRNPGKLSPIDDFGKPLSIPFSAPALPIATASTNTGTFLIESNFPNIEYWRPFEKTINQYCETIEIQFNRKQYSEFMSKIEINQITSTSKPDALFSTIDQTGFGCLSILLTGNEDASSTIRTKINQNFIDCLVTLDKEKIKEVTCLPIMLAEHLQTIAAWLKCRILVYCNGWKKYGNWNDENSMIPLFILNKKEIEGKTEYSIVWIQDQIWTLKND